MFMYRNLSKNFLKHAFTHVPQQTVLIVQAVLKSETSNRIIEFPCFASNSKYQL